MGSAGVKTEDMKTERLGRDHVDKKLDELGDDLPDLDLEAKLYRSNLLTSRDL